MHGCARYRFPDIVRFIVTINAECLSNVRFVLVRPSHPGNIGAAARAMKAMGLADLRLVSPSQFPSAEASARAAGADDVLANAHIEETLGASIAGCTLVFGTSTRQRSLRWPEMTPQVCALRAVNESKDTQIAFVFGPERYGLSNDDLGRCHYSVQVPTNPDFSSLNLAATVQILAYELRIATLTDSDSHTTENEYELAPVHEVELLYEHLWQVMEQAGYLNPKQPGMLKRRLRRLFNRAHLERAEVQILRGFLSAIKTSQKRS